MLKAEDKGDGFGPWALIEHEGYIFRWRWYSEHKSLIQWEVHKIAGEVAGRLVYEDERHTSNMDAFTDPRHEPIDGGHVLYGTVKFDGCCDIQQSRPDCMMHFCDSSMFVDIAKDIHSMGRVFLEASGSGWE